MRGVVLLLAGGRGDRLAAEEPKAFVRLGGLSLLRRAAEAAASADLVDAVVVAAPAGSLDRAARDLDGLAVRCRVVEGGDSRQASAAAALAAAGDPAAVAVHDAARALCPPLLFDACLAALDASEAALVALPAVETVKLVAAGAVTETLDRDRLVLAQTPQAFRTAVYRRAHEAAAADGFVATDDAALVERIGVPVTVLAGDERNIKITTKRDLVLAGRLLCV